MSVSFRTEPMPLSSVNKVLKTELRKPFRDGRQSQLVQAAAAGSEQADDIPVLVKRDIPGRRRERQARHGQDIAGDRHDEFGAVE